MPKKTKTPAERAQEQLDVADRKVKRLTRKADDARLIAEEVDAELQAAVTERNAYANLRDAFSPPNNRVSAEVAQTPPMTAEEESK